MTFLDFIHYIGSLFVPGNEKLLVFSQFHFWAFLLLIFPVFALLGNKVRFRNAYLFFVSLLFYWKTGGLFVILLMLVICSDYAFGIKIFEARSRWKKKFFLSCSVILDLTILVYFKYSYFFVDLLNDAAGTDFRAVNLFNGTDVIMLPAGISFFLFTLLSYTVDVYRGKTAPVFNFCDFGFYVSFFPRLITGPIVRAEEFIPQMKRPYNISPRLFNLSVFYILSGLCKKIIISDYLALNFVDRVFSNPQLFSGFENLSAMFCYSMQIYADFSGYTDAAIGVALLMGFSLPQNFDSPYCANDPQNFWKRWHITLSRWLQDYLYIPLGGNRRVSFAGCLLLLVFAASLIFLTRSVHLAAGMAVAAVALVILAIKRKQSRRSVAAGINSFLTMLLGGLWHGANAAFIMWGGVNGAGIIACKWWRTVDHRRRMVILGILEVLAVSSALVFRLPFLNFLAVWVSIVFTGYGLIYGAGHLLDFRIEDVEHRWAVFQTFLFITFAWLFFRAGSNMGVSPDRGAAWKIVTDVLRQIGTGSNWTVNIGEVIHVYRDVYAIFFMGIFLHWLPDSTKHRCRLFFVELPVPVTAVLTVVTVFLIYQFVSSDFIPFIYFQF